jgi:hypothetical protein
VPLRRDYFAREDEEYALAEWHAAASSVVREQLVRAGIPAERIWQSPTARMPRSFTRAARAVRSSSASPSPVCSACARAEDAARRAGTRRPPEWRIDFYGGVAGEAQHDLAAYKGKTPLEFHGAVSQERLAEAFRNSSVLVLPSLEEGFGLVVPQALNCGLPAIVSDRVGGKDLVRHRINGSIVPVQNAAALAEELDWWAAHPARVNESFGWTEPARQLIAHSTSALL